MSDQVLNLLKYFLLALVWLFFLRILRVVWVEIRSADGTAGPGGEVAAREGVIPAAPSRPPARRPGRLRIVEPADLAGRSYPLGGSDELVVGRTTGSGVPLPGDSFVSSRHARVFPRGDEMWIEDLGSTNGTFVNSTRISAPTALRAGDRLQIGRTVLEVEA